MHRYLHNLYITRRAHLTDFYFTPVLEHFAVHPESQRRGVGTALIQHGIKKARELGIDIFLMAFVSGFKLYENTGFKLLESIVQDATRLGGNNNYAVRFMELEVTKD